MSTETEAELKRVLVENRARENRLRDAMRRIERETFDPRARRLAEEALSATETDDE